MDTKWMQVSAHASNICQNYGNFALNLHNMQGQPTGLSTITYLKYFLTSFIFGIVLFVIGIPLLVAGAVTDNIAMLAMGILGCLIGVISSIVAGFMYATYKKRRLQWQNYTMERVPVNVSGYHPQQQTTHQQSYSAQPQRHPGQPLPYSANPQPYPGQSSPYIGHHEPYPEHLSNEKQIPEQLPQRVDPSAPPSYEDVVRSTA